MVFLCVTLPRPVFGRRPLDQGAFQKIPYLYHCRVVVILLGAFQEHYPSMALSAFGYRGLFLGGLIMGDEDRDPPANRASRRASLPRDSLGGRQFTIPRARSCGVGHGASWDTRVFAMLGNSVLAEHNVIDTCIRS